MLKLDIMNTNIFQYLCSMIVMGLVFVACSQEEYSTETPANVTGESTQTTVHYYKMNLVCAFPEDDQAAITRGWEFGKWKDSRVLYFRFKTVNGYIYGEGVYHESEATWYVAVEGELPNTDSENCEIYYFYNANGKDDSSI